MYRIEQASLPAQAGSGYAVLLLIVFLRKRLSKTVSMQSVHVLEVGSLQEVPL